MKILVISRGDLELTKVRPNLPVITIGRSPTCNAVLRAPEVAPIHFLMEWVGAGAFDPNSGTWAIFDISQSQDQTGEGIILSGAKTNYQGFDFSWIEGAFEGAADIGGHIQSSLEQKQSNVYPIGTSASQVLELVQIRTDSGAVEEVVHLRPQIIKKPIRPLRRIPAFRIMGSPDLKSQALQILMQEMPGAQIFRKGQPIESAGKIDLQHGEVIKVHWNQHDFFLRFVFKGQTPRVPHALFRDPLLLRVTLITLLVALGAGGGGFYYLFPNLKQTETPAPPKRVAKIEIPKVSEVRPDTKPATPPQPAPPVVQKAQTPAKPAPMAKTVTPKPQIASKGLPKADSGAKRSKDVAKTAAPPRPITKGVATTLVPTKPDIDSLGVLGALKEAAPNQGPTVQADKLVGSGVIQNSDSHQTAERTLITGSSNPLLTHEKGAANSGGNVDLAQASTSIQGQKGYAPTATGPIARRSNGKSGDFESGDGLKGSQSLGNGAGVGGGGVGSLDGSSGLQVTGGLDKETVKRVISSYRGQIRTCYERALLSNPKLSGRVVFQWLIAVEGPVNSVEIKKGKTGSALLESCVMGVIKDMKFPKAENQTPTTVIYPFVFQPKA